MIFTKGTLYVAEKTWDLVSNGLLGFVMCDSSTTQMNEDFALQAGDTVVVSSLQSNRTFLTEVEHVALYTDMNACIEALPDHAIRSMNPKFSFVHGQAQTARRLLLTDSELCLQGPVYLVYITPPQGGDPSFFV